MLQLHKDYVEYAEENLENVLVMFTNSKPFMNIEFYYACIYLILLNFVMRLNLNSNFTENQGKWKVSLFL